MTTSTFDQILNQRAARARRFFEIPNTPHGAGRRARHLHRRDRNAALDAHFCHLGELDLMILGIGFVAFITASVAAHFVDEERDDQDLAMEVRRINERLDLLTQLLHQNQEFPAHIEPGREASKE